MKLAFLLAAALLLAPSASAAGAGPLQGRTRFMLLPFEPPTPAVARRLPEPKPLLWPLRAWLLDHGFHLVTSIHRNLESVKRDARRERLDTLLFPSLAVNGDRLVLRLEARDEASGSLLGAVEAWRPLPPRADPRAVEALLPGLADELYRALM
ncbi:MAG: hypothetical protein HYZ13_05255 [Acidobacteria bacterium]|nr:hypothetical protein [Acidobacteriota bacterium]